MALDLLRHFDAFSSVRFGVRDCSNKCAEIAALNALDGNNYDTRSILGAISLAASRLISPEIVVPDYEAADRLWFGHQISPSICRAQDRCG